MKNSMFLGMTCLLLTGLLSGCGNSAAESPDVELHPATGTIKLNGEPLGQASVTFISNGTGTQYTYFGATDPEGKFVLKNRQGVEGCEAGQFKVIVSKRVLSDGSPMPQEDSPEAAAMAADSKELLPPKFSSREATELMYEVAAGGQEIQIDLNE
ncbi:MAG: hypothetical protein HUJ26_19665 [Planctomycetaceae bacterium]|nr:hypothetical protein [Planctomycetaceae bacterium]